MTVHTHNRHAYNTHDSLEVTRGDGLQ